MTTDQNERVEVERIRRVSDQICTGHAALRDRYALWALMLDLGILISSAWLLALAFIDPEISKFFTPPGLNPTIWEGILAFLTFVLTLLQLKTDWKGRAEAHSRSFGMYAEVKREAGYLMASSSRISAREFMRLASRYDMASDVGVGIPEKEFLRLKGRHKVKVEISKTLDARPGANIALLRLKIFWRDNSEK